MNQVLYGFLNLKEVFLETIEDVGIPQVYDAITQSVTEHNRQLNSLTSLFVMNTSEYKVRYYTPSVARLQPLDENGRARPILPAGKYDVAFPLQSAGSAWGANYISRVKMTVQQANNITAAMLTADARWMRDHILAALFYDGNAAGTGWTFADPEHGSLGIFGLADADTVVYNVMAGSDSGATDDHYLAQAAAIADAANPFPAIYTELTEHPENGGEVVVLVPTNLKASIEALTTFYPISDPNLRAGTGVTELVGRLGVEVPGNVIGYVDKCWIVEWSILPNNYMIAVTTDGPRPIAMRQETNAQLQGFRLVAERNDHPFYESQWLRIAGFGAWNRVGAAVIRIGNANYAIPTGYSSPIP